MSNENLQQDYQRSSMRHARSIRVDVLRPTERSARHGPGKDDPSTRAGGGQEGVGEMLVSERAKRMAEWAERKADEAAASTEPWWLGNLRTYQNMASKFWHKHYTALREEQSSTFGLMKIYIHHIQHADTTLQQRLDWLYSALERVQTSLDQVISTQGVTMATIKELVASVAAVKGKVDSIGALISQLREQITGLTNGNLPADVQAQVDQAFADAEAAKTELSAAVDNPGAPPAPVPNASAANAASTSGVGAAPPFVP